MITKGPTNGYIFWLHFNRKHIHDLFSVFAGADFLFSVFVKRSQNVNITSEWVCSTGADSFSPHLLLSFLWVKVVKVIVMLQTAVLLG